MRNVIMIFFLLYMYTILPLYSTCSENKIDEDVLFSI